MTATLTVNLNAVSKNYQLLAAKVAPAQCAAVIKADAYGLGTPPIAKALWGAGCRFFYVALLEEAVELRGVLPDATIAVLNGLTPNQKAEQDKYKLISVMNHAGQLPGILHVDTGMNRLGFNLSDALPTEGNHMLMSHLACANMPEHHMNREQLVRFKEIRAQHSDLPCSLANSSGIFLGEEYYYQQVRPGSALYGFNPTPAYENPMQPVVTLTAPIVQMREIDTVGTVGYGSITKVKIGTRLATIALGYADGVLCGLSDRGSVFIEGQKCPILGRVSMDLIIADITHLPKKEYRQVELLNAHQTISDITEAAGAIGYEALTNLGQRFTRIYQN